MQRSIHMAARFGIVRKGYDPASVDEHISNLENIISSYKDKDAAIKNAIVSAQLAADDIIRKAKAAEEDLIKNARNQSGEIKKKSEAHVRSILELVKDQKAKYQTFVADYNALLNMYLHQNNDEDFAEVKDKFETLENYLLSFTAGDEEESVN